MKPPAAGSSTRPRIPLTVIGGFLGAGKTSLLNHWLRHAAGRRLAVLVNDFGVLNIDADLISANARTDAGANAGTEVAVTELTNGCVCCQIGDDLSLALIGVLESSRPFDAVVIEASGVSDPWRIAQLGRADPGLVLDGVIVLVDAEAVRGQWRDPLLTDTIERQLRAADLVVVNKIDRVDEADRAALHAWVEQIAGPVPQFDTCAGQLPAALLGSFALPAVDAAACDSRHEDEAGHERAAARVHQHQHEHVNSDGDADADGDGDDQHHRHEPSAPHAHSPDHGALFDTWSCRPAQIFEAATLRTWLGATPPGLLRLKGVLRTLDADGRTGWSELQFAGRHGALRRTAEPTGGAALVAIGLRGRLPVAALQSVFSPDPPQ